MNKRKNFDKCESTDIEIENEHKKDIPTSYDGVDPTLNLVHTYLADIVKIPLLSKDEEFALAKTIQEGSPTESKLALDKLVNANLRLVFSIAKRYYSIVHMPFLDVIQNGNLGLIKAARKFDYKMGFKFSTYAPYWIKQSIFRMATETSRNIRLPTYLINIIYKVQREIETIKTKTGKIPSNEEIAERLNISVDIVEDALIFSQDSISLETPIGDDESDSSLIDFIPDNKSTFSEDIETKLLVNQMLEDAKTYLSESEIDVIQKRFGFYDGTDYTLEQIAKERGVTRERIRQIERNALGKIKFRKRKYR